MKTSAKSRGVGGLIFAAIGHAGGMSLLALALTACGGKGAHGSPEAGADDAGAPDQRAAADAFGDGAPADDGGQPDVAPPPLCAQWKSEMIASTGSQSDYRLALAIHGDVPHVAFLRSEQSLVYGVRGAAGGWQITEVANEANVGLGLDLAVDADGNPHLVYLGVDGTGYSLRHSWLAGGSWQTEVIETPVTGLPAALVFDSAGTIHVAYSAANRGRHAWKAAAGTTWMFENVSAGTPADLVYANGLLHVLIVNPSGMRYAVQQQGAWQESSIASTPPMNARLAVSDGALYVAANSTTSATWYTGPAAAGQFSWPSTSLASVTGLDVVYGADLAIDTKGVPHAVFSYETGSPAIYSPVVLARLINGQWTRETAWSVAYAEHPRLQLDSQGHPHIVFIFFSISRTLYYLSCAP